MKKLLLIATLFMFSIASSQTQSSDYDNKVKNLKTFVENIYNNDSTKIKTYIKDESNGKIFPVKTKDIYSEFGFEFSTVYEFVKKNDKIAYIRKTPISPSGDSSIEYEYYFDENKRLIGAEKNVSSFYGENSDVLRYNVEYLLDYKTDKLERINEYYADIDGKKFDPKSPKLKKALKEGMMDGFIEYLDKITFRDLESFMKTEKIKYYK